MRRHGRLPPGRSVTVLHGRAGDARHAPGMVAAAADRRDPVIGRWLEPKRLKVQELVVDDGETLPEQVERG